MIIVNQSKNVIVNFDNINAVYIDKDKTCKKLYANTEMYDLFLGEYATEKRAKEVLQEIITRYKNWENLKAGQPTGLCLPVYEMPKE